MKKEIIWLGAGAALFAAALLTSWEGLRFCLFLLAFLVSGWKVNFGISHSSKYFHLIFDSVAVREPREPWIR